MVDMRVRQEDAVNLVDRNRNILIHIDVPSLFQSAVN